ncbi:hypothetical protein BJV82DRAFT_670695 [Fennellomyces sp. T-0311]|nr:hypothetical protein BJV82DRAFT_670695 [Fennellomyces sp. T-0311]
MAEFSDEKETYFGLTSAQFSELQQATLICSGLSLSVSLFTTLFYLNLRAFYRDRSDRVSLRCVFFSSMANTVGSCMDIIIVCVMDDAKCCLPAGVVTMFFAMLATGSLTAVGVNLLLVFVLNCKFNKYRLQAVYFTCIVAYSLLSIVMPIKIMHHPCVTPEGRFSCWFDVYYEHSRCGDEVWIWHYSFLMFLVIIAFSCSVIATAKLIRVQHVNFGKALVHRTRGQKRNRSALIARVALRCILYPIVPFIANIWGFITQTLVFTQGAKAPFELAMFAVVFQCMEGVLVTAIFFSDPTVTAIVSDHIKSWRRFYVDEYKRINIPKDLNHISVMNHCKQCTRESSEYDFSIDEATRTEPPLAKTIPVRCVDIRHLRGRSSFSRSSYDFGASDDLPPTYMPVAIYRLSSQNPHQLESVGPSPLPSPLLTLDHADKTKMYIPYRYPRVAVMMHYLLRFATSSPHPSAPPGPLMCNNPVATISPLPQAVRIRMADDERNLSDTTLRTPDDNYTLLPTPTPSPPSPSFTTGAL